MLSRFQFILLLTLNFFLFGCASLEHVVDRPEISVLKVTPIQIGLTSQTFRFSLNVFNPNAFALPMNKIQATAHFSGIEVGKGFTGQTVSLAAKTNTEMALDVKTDISKVVNNIGDLFKAKNLNLDYKLTGKMLLAKSNIAKDFGIPFSVTGNLLK